MAVVSAKEIHYGREGGDSWDAKQYEAEDTRVWRVVTDNVYDGPSTALAATGIPREGQQHPNDSTMFVSRRRAVGDSKSKKIWIVTVNYKTSVLGKSENPLADPVQITWATESKTVGVWKDKDGNAILNSSCEYYDEMPQAEVAEWTVRMTKNVGFVPQWILTYRNAINSDGVWLDGVWIAARTAKVSSISIGPWQKRNGVWFRTVDLGIKIADTWAKSILDQGLHQLWDDGAGGYYLRPIRLNNGELASKPVLLDGSGGVLTNPTVATAVFNTHYIYPELPFAFLLY